ncbi:MAG: HPr family phosphocarrier protein [Syntrophorhabdaceae bacterium]|nr:HPr family phosphocarrier protein [Syntrophorhabdaceae bacterium]
MEIDREREFDIKNLLGLHARAAAQLVHLANGYSSEIKLAREGMQVNGKSIMGVLMLAAPKGSRIRVMATGVDADAALDAIGALIDCKFGEE